MDCSAVKVTTTAESGSTVLTVEANGRWMAPLRQEVMVRKVGMHYAPS